MANIAIKVTSVLLFIACLFYVFTSIFTAGLGFDEAQIASVAKNIVHGYGYSTAYHKISLFDPGISTGPTLVFPMAALIKIVGNHYWAARLAVFLVSLFLLLAIMQAARLVIDREHRWLFFLLCVANILFLTSEPAGDHIEGDFLRLWYQSLGEIPASLLVVLSVFLPFAKANNDRYLFLSGLLFGCAIKTKYLALLSLPGLLLIPIGIVYLTEKITIRGVFWRYAVYASGILIPIMLWQAYEFICVLLLTNSYDSTVDWLRQHQIAQDAFVSKAGSILQKADESGNRILFLLERFRWNIVRLKDQLNGYLSFFLIISIILYGLIQSIKNIYQKNIKNIQGMVLIILTVAMMFQLSWWLFLAKTYWIRYAEIGLIYLTFALAASVSLLKKRNALIVSCLLIALFVSNKFEYLEKLSTPHLTPDAELVSMQLARDKLQNLKDQANPMFIGCGHWNPWDLELISSNSLNFMDASLLNLNEFTDHAVYLVRNKFSSWNVEENCNKIQAMCATDVVFESKPYSISLCKIRNQSL